MFSLYGSNFHLVSIRRRELTHILDNQLGACMCSDENNQPCIFIITCIYSKLLEVDLIGSKANNQKQEPSHLFKTLFVCFKNIMLIQVPNNTPNTSRNSQIIHFCSFKIRLIFSIVTEVKILDCTQIQDFFQFNLYFKLGRTVKSFSLETCLKLVSLFVVLGYREMWINLCNCC